MALPAKESLPGEMDAVRAALPHATVRWIGGAGHSPHSEQEFAAECNRAARAFFGTIPALRR
jgi:pimeloyl-ACP methyl ester carboxylesterase